ncbi:nucleotidyltransferase domain-containing protein [Cerasicoccus frondis]|uniref:nucleotidyltransferase domain-containing protein n=1 Tax=Cerasicoccus frondis TaxID=490090 RepID=UPI002852A7F7|nr:nucleotidyltransferase domain-containing protein [Cerasicoccus frondis]
MSSIPLGIFSDLAFIEACRLFRVKQLHAIGSVLRKPLEQVQDIDLTVEFEREGFEGAFEQFMGFKLRLEKILKRPVDLMTQNQFRNPLFQAEVEQTKETVYAA